jgi:protein tyrosine phosphatase (PTP) superfamily phosphohydrolase (DUF442 family)
MVVGSVQNFGWVEPGVLARGEQPKLEESAFRALHAAGIGTIVSLRPDDEPPPEHQGLRVWPVYHVEDERRLAEGVGLQFRHVPMQDFSAPHPNEVAQALEVLDQAVAEAPAVFVHCRAGAGRTGLVTGAWTIAHGRRSGDEVAASYARFVHHNAQRYGLDPETVRQVQRRVGQPRVWWALQRIAEALGSPVGLSQALDLLPPEPPAEAADWPAGYTAALRPWRLRRSRLSAG